MSWLVGSLVISKLWKPGSPSWKANKSLHPDAGKERKPPSWVKANRPARSRGERRKRPHGFGRLREEPTHRVEHATASCPGCRVPLIGGRVRGSRQVITLPRVRARVTEHVALERACRNATPTKPYNPSSPNPISPQSEQLPVQQPVPYQEAFKSVRRSTFTKSAPSNASMVWSKSAFGR